MFLTDEIVDNILKSLDIGWKGMLALFVAMFFIFITILVLTKIKDKS